MRSTSCRWAEIADVIHQDVDPRIINGQRGFRHCGDHDLFVGGRRRVGVDVG